MRHNHRRRRRTCLQADTSDAGMQVRMQVHLSFFKLVQHVAGPRQPWDFLETFNANLGCDREESCPKTRSLTSPRREAFPTAVLFVSLFVLFVFLSHTILRLPSGYHNCPPYAPIRQVALSIRLLFSVSFHFPTHAGCWFYISKNSLRSSAG